MFDNHYVCSFEILVKILIIRVFISTIVILAFSIIVVILIVLTVVQTGSFGRTFFNDYDTCNDVMKDLRGWYAI